MSASPVVGWDRQIGEAYVPVLEDWLWHVLLPDAALYGVAAACTALLFIGIHNAWDVAVSISLRNRQDSNWVIDGRRIITPHHPP